MTAPPAKLASSLPSAGPLGRSRWLGLSAVTTAVMALIWSSLSYRLRLGLTLGDTFASEVPNPLVALLRQGAADVMFGLATGGLLLLLAQLGGLGRQAPSLLLRRFGLLLLGLLLLNIGLLSQAQHGVFFATGNGLTAQLLEESLSLPALREALALLTAAETLFLLLPLLLFGLLLWLPPRLRRASEWATLGLAALLLGLGLLSPAAPLPEALLHHPVGFVLVELLRSQRPAPLLGDGILARAGAAALPTGDPAGDGDPAGEADDSDEPKTALAVGEKPPQMALLGPQFAFAAAERDTQHPQPAAAKKPYNVLYVLMESTGLDYALRPLAGPSGAAAATGNERYAMPFLRSIAAQGYLLSNHFSSGNSSPRGIFSLLSGLYVMPEVAIYDVRKEVYLPSLASYLGDRYHRFLVTPASLDWYFPHSFLLHSGFGELWGYHALPVRKNAPGGRAHARDEAETVSFFLRRLDEHADSGEPFLAVYYSFLAHWPYPDYGPATHVVSPTRPLHAYYNDLHYLDAQIERIFRHLADRHLLEQTIVVLVGDHGEAFGQHPNNYTHSRMSFNENLRTPAILYQPRLFPPRVISAPTSHVDIVPTLLDALGTPYDPALLQGESLLQNEFRRRYIFAYGNEDTVTSVSAAELKLQISLRDGSCWAFDLKSDPEERRRLGCQHYPEQQQALLAYRRNQQSALRRYNQFSRRSAVSYGAFATRQPGHSP